jgi:putative DNA primase/helicase
VVLCQLDAKMEKPWEQRFKGDPLAEVGKDRGRYVAAVLTIVLAYGTAGRPLHGELEPLNGFGDYSKFVREPLAWLGEADPVATQDMARHDDMRLQRKVAIFTGMASCYGVGSGNPRTLTEMLANAPPGREQQWANLQDAFGAALFPKPLNSANLSYYLRDNGGAVVAGLRLGSRMNRLSIKEWWVERGGGRG